MKTLKNYQVLYTYSILQHSLIFLIVPNLITFTLLAPPSPHTLNTRMGVGPDLLDHHHHQGSFIPTTDHYRSNMSQQSSTDHYRSNTPQQSTNDHYRSNLSQQSATDHYRSNISQQPTDHYRSNITQQTSTDHYRANTSQLPGILKNSSQYHASSAVVTSPQQQHTRQASASPPLPPPPEDNFGHVAASPIVPQEPDLPGWVPKNYLEKGKFVTTWLKCIL